MKRLIRFDWAVKKLLRNKANFEILEGFLGELLKEDIKIHKILEGEGNRESEEDKYNRVDLLVENTKRELIIIEIQNNDELDYFQRMLYGTSKLITEYIDIGKPYADIKKVISVNIVYFDLGQGDDYVYRGTTEFRGLHKNDKLQLSAKQVKLFQKEAVSAIYPEYYVIKVNQFDDVARDALDEWIYFLKNSEIESNFKAKGIQQASKRLEVMKLSPKEKELYDRYLEDLHYKASMVQTIKFNEEERIKTEARHEEKIAMAEKMKREGLPIDLISKLTGLPPDNIQAL